MHLYCSTHVFFLILPFVLVTQVCSSLTVIEAHIEIYVLFYVYNPSKISHWNVKFFPILSYLGVLDLFFSKLFLFDTPFEKTFLLILLPVYTNHYYTFYFCGCLISFKDLFIYWAAMKHVVKVSSYTDFIFFKYSHLRE